MLVVAQHQLSGQGEVPPCAGLSGLENKHIRGNITAAQSRVPNPPSSLGRSREGLAREINCINGSILQYQHHHHTVLLTSFLSILGTDFIIFPALSPTESGMKREGSEDSERKLVRTWLCWTPGMAMRDWR